MTKQYWGDACTTNCVWLFQTWQPGIPKHDDDWGRGWVTEAVFLTRAEANRYGRSRPYAWGKKNEGWRIYGVPIYGEGAERLAQSGVNQKWIDEKNAEYDNARAAFKEQEVVA